MSDILLSYMQVFTSIIYILSGVEIYLLFCVEIYLLFGVLLLLSGGRDIFNLEINKIMRRRVVLGCKINQSYYIKELVRGREQRSQKTETRTRVFGEKEKKEENSERTLGKKNAAVDFRNQSKVKGETNLH